MSHSRPPPPHPAADGRSSESSQPGDLAPFVLNDGNSLPAIGIGTFPMHGEPGIATLLMAIEEGYRLFDTAVAYRTEYEVGEAVRRSGVAQDLVRVSTKIPGRAHGYEAARRSIAESRRTLGVDRTDLHLIHWPFPDLGKYVETWRALVAAQADGEVRSIGVSNFTAAYLAAIVEDSGVVPVVNQIELHPHFPQTSMRGVNNARGILTEAWTPLGRGRGLFGAAAVASAAQRVGVTPAQVVLRWHHQLGVLPIPRSSSRARQRENLAIGGFTLREDEMASITALGRGGGRLWGGDPDVVTDR